MCLLPSFTSGQVTEVGRLHCLSVSWRQVREFSNAFSLGLRTERKRRLWGDSGAVACCESASRCSRPRCDRCKEADFSTLKGRSVSKDSDYVSRGERLILIFRDRRELRDIRVRFLPMLKMGTVPIESSPSHRKAWNVGIHISYQSSLLEA